MLIILIGLRCSGKTTLGGMCAARLGLDVIDLDQGLVDNAGVRFNSVGELLRSVGEARFRELEYSVLRGILACDETARENTAVRAKPVILSLGGGTPTHVESRRLLTEARTAGRVRIVYLHATSKALRARMTPDQAALRPPLLGDDPRSEIERVYAARDPLYRSIADAVLDTSALSLEEACGALTALVRPSLQSAC